MRDKVIQMIGEHVNIPANTITGQSHLISDLGLNSYDIVDLVCLFEDQYEIEIPDRTIRGLQRVDDIVAYLETVQ